MYGSNAKLHLHLRVGHDIEYLALKTLLPAALLLHRGGVGREIVQKVIKVVRSRVAYVVSRTCRAACALQGKLACVMNDTCD